MADTKISALAAVTDVLDTDNFVVARSGATKRITGASLQGGNDFVNLTAAPYNISTGATRAANTAALIQAAQDAAKSATVAGKKLYLPGSSSVYPFNTTQPAYPIRLFGDGFGSTVIDIAATNGLIVQSWHWFTSMSGSGRVTISTTVSPGDDTLTGISSTAGMSAGQMLFICSPSVQVPGTNSGAFLGEWVRIRSVDSGTQVTIWGVVEETYSNGTQCYVVAKTPWNGVELEGFTVVNSAPGTASALADQVVMCGLTGARCDIESISGDNSSLRVDSCFDSEITAHVTDGHDQGNDTPQRLGYGVLLWNGVQNCVVNVFSKRCRHGLTTGGEAMGVPRHVTIRGIASECTGTAWDTHAEGRHLLFDNVQAVRGSSFDFSSDWGSGFQFRAPWTVVKGGLVHQVRTQAIQWTSNATDCEVDGLRVTSVIGRSDGTTGAGIQVHGARGVVRNCHVEGVAGAAVEVAASNVSLIANDFARTAGSQTKPVTATSGTGNLAAGNVGRGGYTTGTSVLSSSTGWTEVGNQVV